MYPVPNHFSACVDKMDRMAYSDPYNGQPVGLKSTTRYSFMENMGKDMLLNWDSRNHFTCIFYFLF